MSSNTISKTRMLAISSMIAAMYVILTLVAAPVSFGVLQLRISEALTILPLFTFYAVPGLTIGCLIANLFGAVMGQAMVWDLLFGTAATLLAAVCTYFIGKRAKPLYQYLFGPLPAVIFNGAIIGGEISLFFGGSFWINTLVIAAEEWIVCYLPGLVLLTVLNKKFSRFEPPFSCK